MKRLRCFVAMAFDRPDTDLLYDHIIERVVRSIPAEAIRVDRVEHNEDINNRIIAELRTCDFAIADLTYARPSVYFEAGFAQCRVPVIYTARADHLRSSATDEHLRVHFDLQMKNIIKWTSGTDRYFRDRLGKRINRTIRPLLRERAGEQVALDAIRDFQSLPVIEQENQIVDTAIREAKRAGYRGSVSQTGTPWERWLGVKKNGRCLRIARIAEPKSASLRDLRQLIDWRSWRSLCQDAAVSDSGMRSAEEHVFLLVLAPVPRARASSAFSWFSFRHETDTYEREAMVTATNERQIAKRTIIHLISGVKSIPSLRTALQRHLGL